MTDHAAEGQQDERMKGLAREASLRTQVAELKDSLAAALAEVAGLRAQLPAWRKR